MSDPRAPSHRSLPRRWAFRVGAVLLAMLASETAFRLVYRLSGRDLAPARASVLADAMYQPHPYTVYRYRPKLKARDGALITNRWGFPGADFTLDKAPGVTRILCLGGSTTAGGEGGTGASYPARLFERCDAAGATGGVEVINGGVDWWTSAESLVTYTLFFQDCRSDLVIIHHGVNDVKPRWYPTFQADYSHFRRPWPVEERSGATRALLEYSDLALWAYVKTRRDASYLSSRDQPLDDAEIRVTQSGAPPPETAVAFRRNLATLAELALRGGARVAVMTVPWHRALLAESSGAQAASFRRWAAGIEEHNRITRELAQSLPLILVEAEPLSDDASNFLAAPARDLVHMSRRGNQEKARLAWEALVNAKVLD